MSTVEIKVPDIGDFKDVPIIEVFVKPGDAVKAEDPLIALESDKATMDVPSPAAGGSQACGAADRERGLQEGPCLAFGAEVRAGAGSRSFAGERLGAQGTDPPGGRPGFREAGALPGGGPGGAGWGRRRAEPPPLAAGRL